MVVCDAHEAVTSKLLGSKTLFPGEGYLLDARFMQQSIVMEKHIDLQLKVYGASSTRSEIRAALVAVQGSSPWIICEECIDFLKLSEADKSAARKAAIQWWKDKSTPGHMPQ